MNKNILFLIVLSLVSAIQAQYNNPNQLYDEFERRLEKIKKIAAESDGKIEIRVLPSFSGETASNQKKSEKTVKGSSYRKNLTTRKDIVTNSYILPNDPDKAYLKALSKFNSREYPIAIEEFNNILLNSPGHNISGECHYWLGECYACLNDKNRAIREFLTVLKLPSSDKKDDALMRVAMCYNEMGYKKHALFHFQNLIHLFPDSEYTEIVHSWLRKKS